MAQKIKQKTLTPKTKAKKNNWTQRAAAHRYLITAFFALAIIFFFLEFFNIGIEQYRFDTITGYGLLTGKEFARNVGLDGVKMGAKAIPSSIFAIIAIASAFLGFTLFLIKIGYENLIGLILATAGTLAMLIIYFTMGKIVTDQGGSVFHVSFQFGFWAVLISFILAALISFFRFSNKAAHEGIPPISNLTSWANTIAVFLIFISAYAIVNPRQIVESPEKLEKKLEKKHNKAQARITKVDKISGSMQIGNSYYEDGWIYTYIFNVRDQAYMGTFYFSYRKYQVEETVDIIYLPERPTINRFAGE
jgi:hypothetical protein